MKQEIDKVKQHIQRVFPQGGEVEIKVEEDPFYGYKSLIKVDAPRGKKLFAKKADKNIKSCLEKTQRAILRQIRKTKTKWWRNTHQDIRKNQFQEV